MNDPLGWILWSWLIFTLGFLGGCWWNGRAYDRGYDDAQEFKRETQRMRAERDAGQRPYS